MLTVGTLEIIIIEKLLRQERRIYSRNDTVLGITLE